MSHRKYSALVEDVKGLLVLALVSGALLLVPGLMYELARREQLEERRGRCKEKRDSFGMDTKLTKHHGCVAKQSDGSWKEVF